MQQSQTLRDIIENAIPEEDQEDLFDMDFNIIPEFEAMEQDDQLEEQGDNDDDD